MLRVLVISLLIIGFVAGARRRARYNLSQRLLSKGDNQVSITYMLHLTSKEIKICENLFYEQNKGVSFR